MYHSLTVALDGSHNARPALIEAVRIAAINKATLSLLHVVSLHDFAIESIGLLDSEALQAQAAEQGQRILDEAAAYARQMGVTQLETHLLQAPEGGSAMSHALMAHIQQTACDLLVIGTHGRRGWRHLLMGSFAEEVMRQCTLPLLIVRNPEDDDNPQPGIG